MKKVYFILGLLLDTSNINNLYFNGHRVREMYFRGQRIFLVKTYPTMSIRAEPIVVYNDDGTQTKKIKIIGTYNDYTNLYRYFDEVPHDLVDNSCHGIVFVSSGKLGTRNLTINTSGRSLRCFRQYDSVGNFSHTFTPGSPATVYAMRSYVWYINNKGNHIVTYSPIIRKSYNTLIS